MFRFNHATNLHICREKEMLETIVYSTMISHFCPTGKFCFLNFKTIFLYPVGAMN